MEMLLSIVILLIALIVYFIPTWLALRWQHSKRIWIIVFSLTLGWTFLGWLLAMSWVCREAPGYRGQRANDDDPDSHLPHPRFIEDEIQDRNDWEDARSD